MRKQVLVIGAGRFGSAVATALTESGHGLFVSPHFVNAHAEFEIGPGDRSVVIGPVDELRRFEGEVGA